MENGENATGVRPASRPRLTGAQRQQSIVEAATEVFARRGYEGARIEEIADAAGVSKALIYEHFPGKRELYSQILSAGSKEWLERVLEAIGTAKGSVEMMERGFGAYLDFVAENPNRVRVIEQEVSDPEIVTLDHTQQRRAERAIAELLANDEYVAARNIDPKHLELLGVMINGASVRAANWWIENPSVPRNDVLLLLMRFMWLGLERIRRNGIDAAESRTSGGGRS